MSVLKNSKIQLIFKIGLSTLIFYFMFKYNKIDFSKISTALKDVKLMLALVSLVGLALLFNSYRWMKILRIQKVNGKLFSILNFTVIGLFFNFMLPGSISGDVVKAIMAAKKWGSTKTKLIFSVFLDRLFGLLIMMTFSVFAYILNYKYLNTFPEIRLSVLSISVCLSICFVLFLILYLSPALQFKPKWLTNLNVIIKDLKEISKRKLDVMICKLMSVGSVLCHIVFFILVFAYYGVQLPITTFMFCLPICTVLMAIPISPGGVGVGQAVFFYMFNIFGEGLGEIAFLAVTILQVIYIIWALVGCLCFATSSTKVKEVTVDR